MRASLTIFKVLGIPVRAHATLLLFVPLVAYAVATQVPALASLPTVNADAAGVSAAFDGRGAIIAGVVVAVALMASVLLHELGHAVEARRHRLGVRSITLWFFGGIASLEAIPRRPKVEALVAIAGPIVSFVLGIVGIGLRQVITDPWLAFTVGYVGWINLVLGAFNLLPAFPLDGGRLLRAGLATRMGHVRATRTAADVGRILAVGLGIIGFFSNIFLILIAFFIYMAASQEAQGVEVAAALEPIHVSVIMDAEAPRVSPDTDLSTLPDLMLRERATGFPVVRGEEVVGVVTLADLRGARESGTQAFRVADVMSRELVVIGPTESAAVALERMNEHSVGRLLVVGGDGRLAGVVTREGVLTAFEVAKDRPGVRW